MLFHFFIFYFCPRDLSAIGDLLRPIIHIQQLPKSFGISETPCVAEVNHVTAKTTITLHNSGFRGNPSVFVLAMVPKRTSFDLLLWHNTLTYRSNNELTAMDRGVEGYQVRSRFLPTKSA